MNIRSLALAGAIVALATPALAGHCPADVAAIDAALGKVSLPAAQLTEVKALRDKGDAGHKAGKHGEAVGDLTKAMRIILNSM